ncbi:MAG: hypothetical protein U0836_24715 [Pirellulales bacterium]
MTSLPGQFSLRELMAFLTVVSIGCGMAAWLNREQVGQFLMVAAGLYLHHQYGRANPAQSSDRPSSAGETGRLRPSPR